MKPGSPARVVAARVLRVGVALVPWAVTLYLHYRLEASQLWDPRAPWRAPASVLIIGVGMAASFALHGWLTRRAP